MRLSGEINMSVEEYGPLSTTKKLLGAMSMVRRTEGVIGPEIGAS